MLDNQITKEERAAIDAWLAENKPKVIPQGKVYYDVTSPIPWREQRRRDFFAKMRQKQFAKQVRAEKIRPLAEQGLSDQEIARQLDIHPKTVWSTRNDFGIKAGFRCMTPDDEVFAVVTDEWQDATDIIARFERSQEATRRYLRRLEAAGKVERTPIIPGIPARGYKWRRVQP